MANIKDIRLKSHVSHFSETTMLILNNKEYYYTDFQFYADGQTTNSLAFLAQSYAILEFPNIDLEFQTSSYLLSEMKFENELNGPTEKGGPFLEETLVGLVDPDTETCIQDVSESCLPKLVEEVQLFKYEEEILPIFDYLKKVRRLEKMRFLLVFPKENEAGVAPGDGIHTLRLKVTGTMYLNCKFAAF